MPKRILIDKKDAFRCLVTEVLPAETPIIFSNDGLYLRCLKNASSAGANESAFNLLVRQEEGFKKRRYVPYSYRIKKSALTFRTLAVIHPGAQWQVKTFYQFLAPLMLHYTKESIVTIRAPSDVASSFYVKTAESDSSKYKKSGVAVQAVDKYLRHCPSYFSYRGYPRLYKFFDSIEFLQLEASYQVLWMIDISRCFDSIYTHTIAWAVKDKAFAKENSSGVPSFGDSFDRVMQSMNYGETSGIVIGPEFSRIFAEVILQAVDKAVEGKLIHQGFILNRDYSIRRYVDDYFVFAKSEQIAGCVYQVIAQELAIYKLAVNETKLKKYRRPFLTEKSQTIMQVSKKVNEFTRVIAREVKKKERVRLVPREIFKPTRLALSFCNEVKLCCAENGCDYNEVSGYLISALKNRATKLMAADAAQIKGASKLYSDALSVILRIVFFLYGVAPSVTASYQLCSLVLMVTRYSQMYLKDFSTTINQMVLSLASEILDRSASATPVEGFIDLESQNLLLSISDLGDDFQISADRVEALFCLRGEASYFNLVTLLYYIKDCAKYAKSRHWAMSQAEIRFADLGDIKENAEKALLYLDLMACPFIDHSRKEVWLSRFYQALGLPMPASPSDLIAEFESQPWFVNWREIDLLNLLERRQLHAVY